MTQDTKQTRPRAPRSAPAAHAAVLNVTEAAHYLGIGNMAAALIGLLLVAYVPGALIFRVPIGNRSTRARLPAEERAFWESRGSDSTGCS